MGELRQRGPFKGQICVSGPHIGGGGSPFNGPLRRFFIETESFTFRSPRLKPLKKLSYWPSSSWQFEPNGRLR